MKENFIKLIAGVILISFVVTSCSQLNLAESNSSQPEMEFGKYSEFSESLKANLSEILDSCKDGRQISTSNNLEYSDSEIEYLEDDSSGAEYLFTNGYISERANAYIERIENAFDTFEIEEDFLDEITAIEKEAMQMLSDTDLDSVMYYAEAVKTSISCFSDDSIQSRSIWKKIKKNIKKIAISTGLGAVVGAAVGFIATGSISTSLIFAGTSAIAGAINSYNSEKICIVFKPLV